MKAPTNPFRGQMWVSGLHEGAREDEPVRLVKGIVRTEINYGYK